MSFFSGLYLYQVVMLAAGALLFIVTLILLVILTATGKEIGKLFLFFALSIVMMGFPAYSKDRNIKGWSDAGKGHPAITSESD